MVFDESKGDGTICSTLIDEVVLTINRVGVAPADKPYVDYKGTTYPVFHDQNFGCNRITIG